MPQYTKRDITDTERRAKLHILLRQASLLLVEAQANIQLEDFSRTGPVGAGKFKNLLDQLGDLRGLVKEGPDVQG